MNRRSNIFDYVIKNFWFENVKRDNHCDEEESEENRIFYYMEQFQRGNFEKKEEFVNYFLSSTEEKVFVIGMRLFMAVANHSDYRMLEEFLGQCEEWQLRVFLAYVYDGLSLHAIPYLLSLYEEWEDTGVENDIARCICGMLGQRYYEEENYNIKILGDMFLEFSQSHDLDGFDRDSARVRVNDFVNEAYVMAYDKILFIHGIGSGIVIIMMSQAAWQAGLKGILMNCRRMKKGDLNWKLHTEIK